MLCEDFVNVLILIQYICSRLSLDMLTDPPGRPEFAIPQITR